MPLTKSLIPYSEARAMPNPPERVSIDPDTLTRLVAARDGSGLGPVGLLRRLENVPEGLRQETVANWLYGASKVARFDYLEFVLRAWESLPASERTVPITDAIRLRLRMLKTETGIGPAALLRGTRPERPDGLKADVILRWMDGKPTTGRKDHLEYVLARWAKFASLRQKRVEIDTATFFELYRHRVRTGVSPLKLLRGCEGVPHGLSDSMVASWLAGRAMSARKDHVEFVMARWAELPDRARAAADVTRRNRWAGYVPITPEIVLRMKRCREATGIGPSRLFRGCKDAPVGLRAATVSNWLSGRTHHAKKGHLEFVLHKWEGLAQNQVPPQATAPKPAYPLRSGEGYVPLTKEVLRTLRRYKDATNLGPSRFLEKARDPPEGLTFPVIANWLSGSTATARRDFLEYVLDEWRRLALESLEAVAAPSDIEKPEGDDAAP